tara:strand:+ start:1568 stop:2452 length:885 start_codon:yes stop_codon:yes gene_type:complete
MSNLYEQIEEEELKLKEESTEELETDPKAEEEEVAEEESEAEAEEEENAEEEEKEPEKEPEQKLDASAHFRIRQEKRALQEENEALKEAAKPKVEVAETDPEPSKEEAFEEWLEWKDRGLAKRADKMEAWQEKQDRAQEQKTLWEGAVNEFQSLEKQFQKTTPDYEAAASHMQTELTKGYKVANPAWSDQQVKNAVSQRILQEASHAAAEGHNPAESLYNQSKARFGYTKQEAPAAKKQVNLKKIDSNRKRSASPLQSGGQSTNVSLGLEEVTNMSMADFAKLTPSQIRELESQ